jgi:RNA polymerase-binding transcription factor DksA
VELASTIIGAVGDLLVLVALVVAVRALNTANGARADAIAADKEAVAARKEAASREIEAQRLAVEAATKAEDRAAASENRERRSAIRDIGLQEIADLERRRDRVERIGQLVEDLFWRVEQSNDGLNRAQWMPLRNSLRHQLVGLANDLPECARIQDAGTAEQAFGMCVNARAEIERELTRIDAALDSARGGLIETLDL